MKDVIPYVAELLRATGAQIELSYNDISATFPLIVITETQNASSVIVDGVEWFSDVGIQLDLYGHKEEEIRMLEAQASDILLLSGFRRSYGQWMTESGMKRRMLQFSCSIDRYNRIYCGANTD